MPNPDDECNDCTEWVEVYSSTSTNLSGWKFSTNDTNKFLIFDRFIDDYLIITKNNESFLSLWPEVNNSKVIHWSGMSLNNKGDKINLSGISGEFDEMNYSSSNENKSWSFFNNEWQICSTPTPGQVNSCPQEPEPECYTDDDCDENEKCEDGVCVADESKESKLEITDADEEATFGDIIDVKLNVYRGDTGKYAVYVRVEDENEKDVSEELILHVFTKYIEYKIKLPIQLKMNCDEKYENNTYFIVVEGLDEKTSQEIKLSGKSDECPEKVIIESMLIEETSVDENQNKSITGQSIKYAESEGSTVLKITPYLLALLSLFIAFYIIKTK
jgi:hypothetical protein